MSAEADPLANLPPFEGSIVGSWRLVNARSPADVPIDLDQKQIAHFSKHGAYYVENTNDECRHGSRMSGYSISSGFLVASYRSGRQRRQTMGVSKL